MKYLKRFNESAKSSIELKKDEIELFSTQGALRNLISDEKITLIGNVISYDKSDGSSVSVLSNYFDI